MLYYAKQGTNGKCLMEECEFMKTECPFCNQHCEVEDELIDKVVECPKCKAEFCVQPLSEEQIIIPSPQIKLAPLFLNKSTSDFPREAGRLPYEHDFYSKLHNKKGTRHETG